MTEPLRVSKTTKLVLAGVLAASLAVGLRCNLAAEGHDPGRPDIDDFNVFMLAGRMVWAGTLDQAYAIKTMYPLEHALSGQDSFMPWSYPPLFGLLMAPLAALPLGAAFVLFAGLSLSLFLAVLRRLGGDAFWPVLMATLPSVFINLRSGQNGLLTAGLLGLAALFLLARKPGRAGAAVACLAIKPHLALAVPMLLLVQRQWLAIIVAAAGAALLTGISVAVLGSDVFRAFLGGLAEVGRFMARGAYPMHRMSSVYTCLLSFGVPSFPAVAVHGTVATGFLAWTCRAILRAEAPRTRIGLALMSTVFVSPYFYDYDLTVFGVGVALVAPALSAALPTRRYGFLLGGVALSQTLGIFCDLIGLDRSLAAPVLAAVFCFVLRTVARATASSGAAVAASSSAGAGARLGAA